jgi:hypothetical protein
MFVYGSFDRPILDNPQVDSEQGEQKWWCNHWEDRQV